jgi:hypothetical protein
MIDCDMIYDDISCHAPNLVTHKQTKKTKKKKFLVIFARQLKCNICNFFSSQKKKNKKNLKIQIKVE